MQINLHQTALIQSNLLQQGAKKDRYFHENDCIIVVIKKLFPYHHIEILHYNNNLNFGFYTFANITYDMEPYNFSYAFTRSSERNMMRCWQVLFSFFYFIAFVMKCKVATSITLTFCEKNMDMHDVRVIYWCIPLSPDSQSRSVNVPLSTWH